MNKIKNGVSQTWIMNTTIVLFLWDQRITISSSSHFSYLLRLRLYRSWIIQRRIASFHERNRNVKFCSVCWYVTFLGGWFWSDGIVYLFFGSLFERPLHWIVFFYWSVCGVKKDVEQFLYSVLDEIVEIGQQMVSLADQTRSDEMIVRCILS